MKWFSPVMPFALLWMLNNLNVVLCKGVLIIKFAYYVNLKNLVIRSNEYCDSSRHNPCETYLRIWLDDGNTAKHWVTSIESGGRNGNYYFKDKISKDQENPIHWRFTDFQPVMYKIEAWDSDSPEPNERTDELLDTFRGEWDSAAKNVETNVYMERNKGDFDRYVKVILELRCDKHYYGDVCQVYCVAPKNGVSQSFCNSEGKLVCKKNYFGSNCTVYCKSRDDSEGHYTCDQKDGSQICMKNYYGPKCTLECEFPKNVASRYECDSEGNIFCQKYYFGKNCTIYCKPRYDDRGHYNCSSNGDKICLEHYFGSGCEIYCSPRNDDTGHYTCDEDGNKICMNNYYGPNCAKHCVPQERLVNSMQTKTECDEDGNKITVKSSYKLVIGKFTFAEAVTQCSNIDGTVAEITSNGQQKAADDASRKHERRCVNYGSVTSHCLSFIGLKTGEDFRHKWMSGSNSSYRAWAPGQPDNFGLKNIGIYEGCVVEKCTANVGGSKGWIDVECNYRISVLCEVTKRRRQAT